MSKKIMVVCDPREKSVSLQQIPSRLKSAFVSRPGYSFVDIDFSQMEYRVAASLSQDKNMIDMLNGYQDFYATIASQVYHKPVEDISKEERSKVKTVSLGIMYGMGENSVAARLNISPEEARSLMDSWKSTFPQFMKFRRDTEAYIKATGKTPSYFGRYRDFGDPSTLDDTKINEGVNTVIQGCASDLIKIAMVMTDKELKKTNAGSLNLTLHDELLFEVEDSQVAELAPKLSSIMQEACKRQENWCNFKVSMNTGKTWAEASK